MKNIIQIEGFLNRHINPLPPNEITRIIVLYQDERSEKIALCDWIPLSKSKLSNKTKLVANGYLGTARIIKGEYIGTGFNVWEQNNNEFIYYAIIEQSNK